ncbi:hypothetical protein FOMPIDRAFT_1134324 [Fomitopsis schrenkii]|uniref:Uncharacterized protein n=1 Tax=Fomitopsis schrenkii TaxID=2126942 RepID=S8DTB0_FOMSC|nr:hypothetical protein FOMPIDRAFT_1134324 [Fomitopsis schrenkii]
MADTAVPLVSANIATIFLESFLYGNFFVLTITSVYLLAYRRKRLLASQHPQGAARAVAAVLFRSPMFLGAISLFVTITSHWILTCIRAFDAFVNFQNGTAPLEFYGNLKDITEVVKTGWLMSSLVIGDTLVIYRLWVIWNRRTWVIIFPLCTLGGLTACGVGITYQFSQYYPGENVFVSEAGRWITSDCVFTLCTNVYSTSMIAYQVWRSHRRVKVYSGTNVLSMLAVFIESAALYTMWTMFFFIAYQSHSNLQFVAVDSWPAMSGISFMLINVRVGLGWAQSGSDQNFSSTAPPTRIQRTEVASAVSYQMRPLAVKITVEQEDEMDAKRVDGGAYPMASVV